MPGGGGNVIAQGARTLRHRLIADDFDFVPQREVAAYCKC
jgi:hypothetical protein